MGINKVYGVEIMLVFAICFLVSFIDIAFKEIRPKFAKTLGSSLVRVFTRIPILALPVGIIILLLKGLSILTSVQYSFYIFYSFALTYVCFAIIGQFVVNSVVVNGSSVVLAHKYTKEGLEQDEMKKKTIQSLKVINKIKIISIFILSIITFAVIASRVQFECRYIAVIACAIVSTIFYSIES